MTTLIEITEDEFRERIRVCQIWTLFDDDDTLNKEQLCHFQHKTIYPSL